MIANTAYCMWKKLVNNVDLNNVKKSTQTLTTRPTCDSDFSELAEGSVCSDEV